MDYWFRQKAGEIQVIPNNDAAYLQPIIV